MSDRIIKISRIYKLSQQKLVSFDFDDTLRRSSDENPIRENVNKLLGHSRNGDSVYIVTSREDSDKNRAEINKFLLDNGLESFIQGIFLVGGLKRDRLIQLGVSQHYDDKDHEIQALKDTEIFGIKV
jgi:acid phosphatase class B